MQTAAEGFDDQPAYGSRNDQPRGARKNRPHHPACTLPCKIQQHADPKDSIERRNDAQIERSYREHGGIAAEQFEPPLWKYRGGEPDRLRQGGGNKSPIPRNAFRPRNLAGTDIDADHCQDGRPQPEQQGNEDIIEPRGYAVAGDSVSAEQTNGACHQNDREVCLDRADGRQPAHAQHIAQQARLDAPQVERQPQGAARGSQIEDQDQRGDDIVDDDGHSGPHDAKARKRSPTEDQQRR